MKTILKTKELTKKYGHRYALNNVNMTVNKGDIYGFIGKNGAGKTTLMRLALSLAFPTSGSVELFEGEDAMSAGSRIGSLIEAPGLYKSCTALENLNRYSILYGSDPSKNEELLDFVGLSDTGKKPAGAFSLGMRQRLGIAIAMLGNPELLILDEPVNGLDPSGMREVRELIMKLNKELGTTVLISSHLLDELSKMVTCYGIINNGCLVEEISQAELEVKCCHRLIFNTDNPSKAVLTLVNECGLSEADIILNGEVVQVLKGIEKSAYYNSVLVNNGINVESHYLKNDGIEEYFMQRIGD